MPRPIKPKLVKETPRVDLYKPRGIPAHRLEETVLRIEELEALRLVDLEGLYQEDAARSMGISRQTLQRMVTEARSKLIEAIYSGKALRIEGGTYILQEGAGRYRCGRCGQPVSGYGRRRRGWRCPTCD
ncbi:DUF134 domain-containing protein [Candidatus Solincola sp.]|nr:DUF134 domain-containing protein [Actinomycetota bacterium]MDI7252677.1 DUF134 domain-containing protein [Actinomycetota bacterium]